METKAKASKSKIALKILMWSPFVAIPFGNAGKAYMIIWCFILFPFVLPFVIVESTKEST